MDTQNSYVVSDQKPIAVIGLNDVIVVNTDEAILMADKSSGLIHKTCIITLNMRFQIINLGGAFYEIKRGKKFCYQKIKNSPSFLKNICATSSQ
ncbi:MAG: Mannose-1-phosphate guanylyltransferase [Candidatus Midichloria mitochondrii]